MTSPMHADEIAIDETLVRRLLTAQFPAWASLPLAPVREAGTDHALWRLGDDLAARLPRIPSAARQAAKEQAWLPRLAPSLPLAVPLPVGFGAPGAGYPWRWTVQRWLPGEPATPERLADPGAAAGTLARFLVALRAVDAADGPPPGEHNFGRGEPLANRDAETRAAIAELDRLGLVDPAAATAVWEAALAAPVWAGPPTWLHGDLLPGNLLVADGALTAVIDFGGLGAGDPTVDLLPAWAFFPAAARARFRAALGADDASWARGRGWALSFGAIALPYYRETNRALAGVARRAITAAIADLGRGPEPEAAVTG